MITIISSLFLFTSFSSAQSLTFNYPNEVSINEEFSVVLDTSITETSDVKIFVHDSEDESVSRGEYISEIFNSGWKDSWNYLNAVFPEQKEYKIRVTESPGARKICARLRKTGAKSLTTFCQDITVIATEKPKSSDEDEEESSPLSSSSNRASNKKETILPINTSSEEIPKQQALSFQNDKIVLNSQSISSGQKEEFVTKHEKIRKGIVYGFVGLLVVIVILFSLKRL